MIEKYKKYIPISEKIALVDKIVLNPNIIDQNGIINKNNLEIVSITFFVGAYVEDKKYTTDDYDEIIQNKIDVDLKNKLDQCEIKEWEKVLENAIDYVVETRKNEKTNIQAAITSVLNSLAKSIDPKNMNKTAKIAKEILSDPTKLENFGILKDIAEKINSK